MLFLHVSDQEEFMNQEKLEYTYTYILRYILLWLWAAARTSLLNDRGTVAVVEVDVLVTSWYADWSWSSADW